ILQELLMGEIQRDHLYQNALETFSQTPSFDQVFSEFEKKHFPKCQKAISLLQTEPPSLERYVFSRRQILEARLWFDVHAKAFLQSAKPTPLQKQKIEKIQKELTEQLQKSTSFLEEARRSAKKNFVPSYSPFIEEIDLQMKKIIEKRENLSSIDRDFFLKRVSYEVGRFADLALQQRELWLEAVLHECRSLYFTRFPNLNFSFIYSSKGMQYVVMDVMGFMLGQGQFRIVSRCAELQTGTLHALIKPKTLTFAKTITEEMKQTHERYFIDSWRESDIISHIGAPSGVVEIRERMAFEFEGIHHLFLIEKRYENGSLQDYFNKVIGMLSKEDMFDPDTTYSCALQLLTGLVHIHKAQIIHRDIKPANVLCDFTDPSKPAFAICDFGLACTSIEKKLHQELSCSPLFSAPEYAKAVLLFATDEMALGDAVSPKLDVWSLGVVFYLLFFVEMIPWWQDLEGDSDTLIHQVLEKLSHLSYPWIPSQFHKHRCYPLIERMLDPNPEKRWTAQEALDHFKTIHFS
ncbi:MAG: serine/threonine-protein kinase, partial [Chlamydiales bacterium]|nr:serine/threonine-protein kinase [Chlamydiales bacterium]